MNGRRARRSSGAGHAPRGRDRSMRWIIGALALVCTLGSHGAVQASFIIQLKQISANQIEISGSGQAPAVPVLDNVWEQLFLVSAAPGGSGQSSAASSGSLTLNSQTLTSATFATETFLFIPTGGPFAEGAQLSGTTVYTFSGPVTLPRVGIAGVVISNYRLRPEGSPTAGGDVTGTWAVVPLPASAWLMISGFAALGGVGRWRSRRRPEALAVA